MLLLRVRSHSKEERETGMKWLSPITRFPGKSRVADTARHDAVTPAVLLNLLFYGGRSTLSKGSHVYFQNGKDHFEGMAKNWTLLKSEMP